MRATLIVDDERLEPDEMFDRYPEADMPIVQIMANTRKCAFEDGTRIFDPAVFACWPVSFMRLDRDCVDQREVTDGILEAVAELGRAGVGEEGTRSPR